MPFPSNQKFTKGQKFPSPRIEEASPEELSAAMGMEAMLADHLIQEMRKSVPESDFIPLSQGERIYRQMLDSEYARILGESRALGIAELVLAQIKRKH